MPKQAECSRRVTVDDGGASGKGKPDEMNDPSKMAAPASLDTLIVPTPLDSSLQHSHFRQLTNCIHDIHDVRLLSSVTLVIFLVRLVLLSSVVISYYDIHS